MRLTLQLPNLPPARRGATNDSLTGYVLLARRAKAAAFLNHHGLIDTGGQQKRLFSIMPFNEGSHNSSRAADNEV